MLQLAKFLVRQTTELKLIFWVLGLLIGLLQAWAYRFSLSSEDAVSYLDIGDAYLRGDWHRAINAYWSPLYSWLLGFFIAILQPLPYWEFFVVKLVNLFIFLVAFASFDFFLQQLIKYQRKTQQTTSKRSRELPEWIWLIMGYALFLWVSLKWIGIHLDAPDNATAICVYLASGLLLQMQNRTANWRTYLLFGIVLGLGYLSKSVMFPLAFVFLGASVVVSCFDPENVPEHGQLMLRRQTVLRLLAALLAFTIVVAPFIAAISVSKGRLTFGDTGKINYVWTIAKTVKGDKHWQGKEPNSGIPKHPTRQIFDVPATYEFGTPVGGTSPTWYDPSYWYDGLKFSFNLRQQLQISKANLAYYYQLFLGSLLLGYFLLVYAGGDVRTSLQQLVANWFLWLPGVTGLGIYLLGVNMPAAFWSPRYIAPFVGLVFAGVFSSVHLLNTRASKRLLIALMTIALIAIGGQLLSHTVVTVNTGLVVKPIYWQVAEDLQQLGVKSGDAIALIGDADQNAYWARLARVKIVDQVPLTKDFWQVNTMTRKQVLNAIAKTGAKVVVQQIGAPIPTQEIGWQKLKNSDCYTYFLNKNPKSKI
jgi:hypothetical protein